MKHTLKLSGEGPGYVRAYRTNLDEWGIKAQPLFPERVDTVEIMAIAYREVARNLMNNEYRIDTRKMLSELAGLNLSFTAETLETLGFVSRQLSELLLICGQGSFRPGLISFSDLKKGGQKMLRSRRCIKPFIRVS